MIFSLEALQAKHGDSLLLHYGSPDDPRLIVIDGGPKGVFNSSLRPRLDRIRNARGGADPLEIRLLMVSHLDDDHICGVLELSKVLVDAEEGGSDTPFEVVTLWHNAFDDVTSKVAEASRAGIGAHVAAAASAASSAALKVYEQDVRAVVASVGQGRELRDNAEKLSWNVNWGFRGLVRAPKGGKATKDLGDGLSFTVIGPTEERLDALEKEWDKQVRAWRKKKGKAAGAEPAGAELDAIVADYVDKSVYNLSSIVVLAKAVVGGAERTMLLTGDARGDYVLEELKRAKLLKGGKLHVDLLKVPHHGSWRNLCKDFFERLTADHYVFSADGRDDNPDVKTLEALVEARGKDAYTIHLTNDVPHAVERLEELREGLEFEVDVRATNAPSVQVDLGEPIGV
jgi:hypothetical protein